MNWKTYTPYIKTFLKTGLVLFVFTYTKFEYVRDRDENGRPGWKFEYEGALHHFLRRLTPGNEC